MSRTISGPRQLTATNWREPTDREQRRLAEKGDPKYIFIIPRAILPKPSFCDEMTATKSVTKSCNEIVALRSVCRGQLTRLHHFRLIF